MVRVSDVSGHCSKIDFVLFNKLKNKISERIEEVWNFDSYGNNKYAWKFIFLLAFSCC